MDSRRAHGSLSLIERARALRVAALVATLHAVPSALAAQSTDDYWRALQQESDAAIVLTASAPATIPEEIADGLRLFRSYEISGDEGDARRAQNLLAHARVAPEHRAWHALALAMVYARGPDSRMRLNDDGDWVTDPNSLASARSLRLLRGALELRPQFREAALELATWALDREHRGAAASADSALAAQPADATVLLTRASLALLLNRAASAAELAEQAEAAGADPSIARHTRAWALFQIPNQRGAGVFAYHDGARVMTDAGRREYGRFLEPVLGLDEHEAWRALSNEEAAAWLERYWRSNAARAGVMPDERLVEHYRRAHRARIEFPNASPLSVLQLQSRFVLGEDSRRFGLSLRGLMLLRHGDPYRLAAIEGCLSNPWPAPGGGTVCNEFGSSRTRMMQNMARLARGDSFDPFSRGLTIYDDVYAFRGAAGTNDLVFAVGLPVRSVNALIEGHDRIAGILSTVLLTDSGQFVRNDSAFNVLAPRYTNPLGGDIEDVTLLFGVLHVPAEHASREYRLTVSDVRRHAGATARGEAQTYAFDEFSVSDVVVAPDGMPARWGRGETSVAFAPLATYLPGSTVELYYEVYGLAAGAAYSTEIQLEPPAEGVRERLLDLVRDRSIRFRFENVAEQPHAVYGVQQSRTISLEGVEPGIWTMRVRVTDAASGRTAEREATIEIED